MSDGPLTSAPYFYNETKFSACGQPREEAVRLSGEEGGGSEADPQDEAPLPSPGRRPREGQRRAAGTLARMLTVFK